MQILLVPLPSMFISNLDLSFMYVIDITKSKKCGIIDIESIKTYISEKTNIPYHHILLFQKDGYKFIEFYEEILPSRPIYFMYNDKKFSKIVLQSLVSTHFINKIEEREEKCIIM